jgi:hypothetical protein
MDHRCGVADGDKRRELPRRCSRFEATCIASTRAAECQRCFHRQCTVGLLVRGLIVMVVAMSVVAVVPLLVMSIGVTMPVTVIMVFPGPRAFTVMPSMRSVLVVRTGPICAGVGRLYIVTGNPAIVLTLRRPESAYPDERRFRRWRGCLITNRRRCYPDINGNLRPCWRRESCCNNS